MLKLCKVTKAKVSFLVLVYVFNFDLFEFSAAILEKGLFYIYLLLSTYYAAALEIRGTSQKSVIKKGHM